MLISMVMTMMMIIITAGLALLAITDATQEQELVSMALAMVGESSNWVRSTMGSELPMDEHDIGRSRGFAAALRDCGELYGESEARLVRLQAPAGDQDPDFTAHDALTWLSAVLANHRTCLDGLRERGLEPSGAAGNLTEVVVEALRLYRTGRVRVRKGLGRRPRTLEPERGVLASWDPSRFKADFVVAQDGSGTHRTINEAISALSRMGHGRPLRVVIYVKAGVYREHVEIERRLKNVMLVGDGMDRTIVSGSRNVPDGASTYGSATFGVSGDGFWARDMTFENVAGPHKHQAVALRVSSDQSVFYRCSFRGYQDTLFVHSLRQFYRDCRVYGTIDFIFGDASAVFQNCDIFVRQPMRHQVNMITAQGRDSPHENTGISVQNSRVRPAPDFAAVKNSFWTFLGRPWKRYSRTVFLKTDLDALINPRGWREWEGNFALSTLYYAEYMNTGAGAYTAERVNWPGFHVLRSPREAAPFSVSNFLHGEPWIAPTGVPFSAEI